MNGERPFHTRDENYLQLKYDLYHSRYRQLLPSPLGPAFGIDMIAQRPGSIRVGHAVYAIEGDNLVIP